VFGFVAGKFIDSVDDRKLLGGDEFVGRSGSGLFRRLAPSRRISFNFWSPRVAIVLSRRRSPASNS
jgi:hypothetical protein